VVLRYKRKVYKHKDTEQFSCAPAPPAVLDKSFADVSFLAGMVIDKFRYHLPLYRQHQRLVGLGDLDRPLDADQLRAARSRSARAIYRAQLTSIVSSQVLTMTRRRSGQGARPRAR